jgi:hypothetical protein
MAVPDYLICLNCETPCYVFEWKEEEITEATCEVCGNDEADQFVTPDDYDALISE